MIQTSLGWPWVRSKAIDLAGSTRVARNLWCFMDLGAIEVIWTCPFDLGSSWCQVLHGLEINLRQSNSPVLLRWRRKAIEFTCLTQVAQNVKCCMTWRSIKAIKLTQLTLMAQNPKRCMVWRSIEGNRTHAFDSGGAVCQALHGLEINWRQSNSPVWHRWRSMPSAARSGDQSKVIELTCFTYEAQ